MMKVLANVQTKTNMKKGIEVNTKLNMTMNMNVKMKMNTMLQIGMRCCRFAGDPGGQVKATGQRGPRLDSAPEGVPRRNIKAVISDMNPADARQPDEADMSQRHGTRGGRERELQILLCFLLATDSLSLSLIYEVLPLAILVSGSQQQEF
jgi:hypothetical protein